MTPEGLVVLKGNEGLRLKTYKDSVGVLTNGYGHTGADVHEGQTITEAEADANLVNDLVSTTARLIHDEPWIAEQDPVRQDVLENIAFNVGVYGEEHWPSTLAHFKAKDFKSAAHDLLNEGKWTQQVGQRANLLAYATLYGKWGGLLYNTITVDHG